MRNPNGYGSVVRLSGNRRKPYAVRKTMGFDGRGYPVYLNIGYVSTREEGMIMLAEYNKNPWDVQSNKTTLDELYELWKEKRMSKLGASNANSLRSAYKHCKKYGSMRYVEIKAYHMQDCIDDCKSPTMQKVVRSLWVHLDKLAMELDLISKEYSGLLTVVAYEQSTEKVPFRDEEVRDLWLYKEDVWRDVALFMLYTGFRIAEALSIKVENVDLKEGVIVGGMKTKAGKNRTVPIHHAIAEMVAKYAGLSKSGYLFEHRDRQITYDTYRRRWDIIMNDLNMHHTPHDCRHTIRTKMDAAGGNETCIDRIMGHSSKSIGERVYTHKSVQELKYCIELVTY